MIKSRNDIVLLYDKITQLFFIFNNKKISLRETLKFALVHKKNQGSRSINKKVWNVPRQLVLLFGGEFSSPILTHKEAMQCHVSEYLSEAFEICQLVCKSYSHSHSHSYGCVMMSCCHVYGWDITRTFSRAWDELGRQLKTGLV